MSVPEIKENLKVFFPNLFNFERRIKIESRPYILQDCAASCKIIFGLHGSCIGEPHFLWDDNPSKLQ